ncbi:MAG: PEGA domain-containing protein [Polyangiales bacterium]
MLTEAPGLTARVDGVERPVERLRDGLAVSAGTRRVTLRAPGFEALEREVPVVGGATVEVRDALEPVRSSLRVECAVPGARVMVDGRALAVTPVREALRVPEGRHRVRVERDGYVAYETEVEVHGQGASVEAGLAWREPIPDAQAARLRVNASRPGAVAFVDGRRVSIDGRDAIPPGPHRLRVEVDRYLPHERDVTLVAGATTPVSVWMDPSPAYREEALSQIRARRRMAFIVGGVGLGLLVAGGVGLAVFAPRYASDLDAYDAADARVEACRDGTCGDNGPLFEARNAAESAAYDSQNATLVSGVVAGAGLVTTVVGAVLLGNAGSLDRFDRPPSWTVSLSPRGAGLSLSF